MYTFNIEPNKNAHQFADYIDIFTTLRGVFLALLVFSASFLAPYVGCNYQTLLKQNIIARYTLLFLIIYFSINLVDPNDTSKSPKEQFENPFRTIIRSVIVFVIFIMMSSVDVTSIILILSLFALLLFTYKYYSYFVATTVNVNEHKFTHDLLLIIQIVLSVCIIGILILSILFPSNVMTSSNKHISIKGRIDLHACQV
jgi:hypothetical protein